MTTAAPASAGGHSAVVGWLFVAGAIVIGIEALKHLAGPKAAASGGGSTGAAPPAPSGAAAAPAGTSSQPAQPSSSQPTPVPQSQAYTLDRLVSWANANGVAPEFLLSIVYHETGGLTNFHNPGGASAAGAGCTTEDSYGVFQINLQSDCKLVHSPAGAGASYSANAACALDVNCALAYWGPHIKAWYDANGGTQAFQAAPATFVAQASQYMQGGVRYTVAEAQAAVAGALGWLR